MVRAASLTEYYRCTLTAVPGGELEFSRCVVFAGNAESAATVAPETVGVPADETRRAVVDAAIEATPAL